MVSLQHYFLMVAFFALIKFCFYTIILRQTTKSVSLHSLLISSADYTLLVSALSDASATDFKIYSGLSIVDRTKFELKYNGNEQTGSYSDSTDTKEGVTR